MKALMIALTAILVLATGCMKGERGAPGVGSRIVSTINCSGVISGSGVGSLNGLEVDYDAVLMASGDVYATAAVIDNGAQVSGTSFYSVGQPGAVNAMVSIVADHHGTLDRAYWQISLNRSTLVTSVVYEDNSLAGPISLTFTPGACTIQNW